MSGIGQGNPRWQLAAAALPVPNPVPRLEENPLELKQWQRHLPAFLFLILTPLWNLIPSSVCYEHPRWDHQPLLGGYAQCSRTSARAGCSGHSRCEKLG